MRRLVLTVIGVGIVLLLIGVIYTIGILWGWVGLLTGLILGAILALGFLVGDMIDLWIDRR